MALVDMRPVSTSEVLERLHSIDLHMVVRKMTESLDGPQWRTAFAEEVQEEYLRFLGLTLAYPKISIVPSRTVDDFWHQHVLDTRAYASDCNEVFGFFLHHYPYFGMNGAADHKNLIDSFASTHQAYAVEFGHQPPSHIWGTPRAEHSSQCSNESECFGGSAACTGR